MKRKHFYIYTDETISGKLTRISNKCKNIWLIKSSFRQLWLFTDNGEFISRWSTVQHRFKWSTQHQGIDWMQFFLFASRRGNQRWYYIYIYIYKSPWRSLAHFRRKNNFATQFDTKHSIFPVTNHKSQNTNGLCTRLEFYSRSFWNVHLGTSLRGFSTSISSTGVSWECRVNRPLIGQGATTKDKNLPFGEM